MRKVIEHNTDCEHLSGFFDLRPIRGRRTRKENFLFSGSQKRENPRLQPRVRKVRHYPIKAAPVTDYNGAALKNQGQQRIMLVKNPNPVFKPAHQSGTRPKLIKDACQHLQSNKVFLWSGFRLMSASANRQRGFNLHLKRAMQAGFEALAYHANLLTGVVHSSCTDMSDMCGLSTVGKSGKKSISRFTRMIDVLERFCLIRTERIWDREQGMWIPKLIQVTEAFWKICGISRERLQAEQRKALGRERHKKTLEGVTPDLVAQFGITEAEQEGRKNFIKAAFKARKADSVARAARRKVKALEDKEYQVQLDMIARDILANATPQELAAMTPAELKRRAQYQRGKLLKQAEQ